MNKKLMLIAIFLLSLLTISAVSANNELMADDAISEEMTLDEDNLIIDDIDDGSLNNLENSKENVLNAKDDGTFTALLNKIDSAEEASTIVLENDYVYDEGFEGGTDGVHFTKTLTIDGRGYSIDGMNKSRVLLVSAPSIRFLNLVIKNGYVNSSGAAFYTHYNNTTFKNCTFINNNAESAGGAAYSSGTTIYNDCKFIGNSANDGGAIYADFARVAISNSYFKDNNATYGGAVSLDRSYNAWGLEKDINNAKISDIDNSVFEGNYADFGGAIYSLHVLNIGSCEFKDNYAETSGGAIYTSNGYVYYMSFTSYAGGVPVSTTTTSYVQRLGLVISGNSTFKNNTAESLGGAIMIGANDFAYSEYVRNIFILEDDTVFDSNSAFRGGAIYMNSALALIEDATFKNNVADWDGGAIKSVGISEVDVFDCSFINNNATDYGGSICSQYNLNVSNSNFTGTQDLDFIDYYNYYDNETDDYYGLFYLENNRMLANNTFDVWYEGHFILEFPIYLVFANKTVHSDENVVVAEIQDENGNSINFGPLNVTFTNQKNSKVTNLEIDFSSSIGGFAINSSSLEKGTYKVSGLISDYPKDNYSVIDGILKIEDYVLAGSDVTKYYGGPEKYTVTLTENGQPVSDANIKFNLNGQTSNVKTNSNGQASLDLNMGIGTYNVSASFEDNSVKSKVTVKSTVSIANAAGTYLNSKVNATFLNTNGNPLANTKVSFKVGSKTYTATTDANGLAIANIDLGVGSYDVTAINPVNNEEKTSKLTISKAKTSMRVSASSLNDIVTLTASLSPSAVSGNVIFTVNKKNYTAKINSAKATLTLDDLDLGSYQATAYYAGNANLESSSAKADFTVKGIPTKIIYNDMNTAPVTTKDGRIGDYFVVKLVDKFNNPLAGLPIKIGFNGKVYDRNTTSNGVAKLQINLPREDIYTFAICFLGDDDYQGSFAVAKITVNKKNPKPNSANKDSTGTVTSVLKSTNKEKTSILYENMNCVSVLGADGRIGRYFTVKLVDNRGKALAGMPIQIGFNGKIYDRTTDENGGAKLQINLLRPTLYTFAIAYLGNDNYQGSFAVAKITVNAQSPKLTAVSKTFKASAKTKSVSATLLTAIGNPIKSKKITFSVNGKTYTGTTNSKGVATVNVSLNKKGSYSCTVKFSGMDGASAKTTKINIKIV